MKAQILKWQFIKRNRIQSVRVRGASGRIDKELRAAYPISNAMSFYPPDRITQSKHQDWPMTCTLICKHQA
jgi:hypothetical protein